MPVSLAGIDKPLDDGFGCDRESTLKKMPFAAGLADFGDNDLTARETTQRTGGSRYFLREGSAKIAQLFVQPLLGRIREAIFGLLP